MSLASAENIWDFLSFSTDYIYTLHVLFFIEPLYPLLFDKICGLYQFCQPSSIIRNRGNQNFLINNYLNIYDISFSLSNYKVIYHNNHYLILLKDFVFLKNSLRFVINGSLMHFKYYQILNKPKHKSGAV